LIKRILEGRVLVGGIFEFDKHQRQTIDEQNYIRVKNLNGEVNTVIY
jgi:hypothetical protein